MNETAADAVEPEARERITRLQRRERLGQHGSVMTDTARLLR